jgi:dolichol-phosphate mannosyltransferase
MSALSEAGRMQSPMDPATAAPRVSLSVVIPCWNEAEVLPETHRRVSAVCKHCCAADFEILFVDDGSTDDTWRIIRALVEADAAVRGIRLSRNHGHQLALTAGLAGARGERLLVLDADLQDPPELLPEMLRLMRDTGADVVYGQRRQRAGETWFKRASAAVFYRLLARATEVPIPMDTGDFRLMTRRVAEYLERMPEQQRFVRGMVSWLGFKQVPILYDRDARFAGATKYPLRRMLHLAVDGITGFSVVPLRIASMLGLGFGLLGLGGLLYALGSWLAGTAVSGWTSVIAAIFLLGGVQLLVLGVIGEYLGRLYLESKRRPLYVIDQVIGGHASASTSPAAQGQSV